MWLTTAITSIHVAYLKSQATFLRTAPRVLDVWFHKRQHARRNNQWRVIIDEIVCKWRGNRRRSRIKNSRSSVQLPGDNASLAGEPRDHCRSMNAKMLIQNNVRR
jgi:hypothetical protein